MPSSTRAVGRPRRRSAWSTTSSCSSVALWTSSAATAMSRTAEGRADPTRDASTTHSGRNRLPPRCTREAPASPTSVSPVDRAASPSSTAARSSRTKPTRSSIVAARSRRPPTSQRSRRRPSTSSSTAVFLDRGPGGRSVSTVNSPAPPGRDPAPAPPAGRTCPRRTAPRGGRGCRVARRPLPPPAGPSARSPSPCLR